MDIPFYLHVPVGLSLSVILVVLFFRILDLALRRRISFKEQEAMHTGAKWLLGYFTLWLIYVLWLFD